VPETASTLKSDLSLKQEASTPADTKTMFL